MYWHSALVYVHHVSLSFPAADCGELEPPMNGTVTFNLTTVGSEAQYTCDMPFVVEPMGSSIRICEFNGGEARWSGTEPTCTGT